ncbi:MAG: phytoene desaturase family protein, partial [Promethearchaeota archaeon]
MKRKKIIIIGAGMAGLSAGCYLQMNGYDTEIFEAGNSPGGLVTSWQRKGYTIDGCIHGLVGSSPDHPMYHVWNEVVDMDKMKFFDSSTKNVIISKDKRRFVESSNLDELERYMKNISSEDSPLIEEFVNDIRYFQKIDAFGLIIRKPRELYNLFDYIKMLKLFPLLKFMKKWQSITAEEFSEKFKNSFLQEITKSFLSPILYEMLVLSEMDSKRSGYPIGGSLSFSKQIAQKYLQVGGKIHYNTRVSKINTSNDGNIDIEYTIGITTESGDFYKSDIVISAMDGYATHYDLLGGKFIDKKLSMVFKSKELNPSQLYLSLGINKVLDSEIPTQIIQLKTPFITPDGTSYETLHLRIFNFDPTLAPEGKTLINIELDTLNFDFWHNLRNNNRAKYRNVKNEIALNLINILDGYLSDLKDNVDMIDVATPATFYRYTNNRKGSIMGWEAKDIFEKNPFKKELKTLKNFYMIGQWVQPGGGVPTAFLSGRDVAQIICKRDHKPFNHTSKYIETPVEVQKKQK